MEVAVIKQYLTISEFAALRNVNLNSIRYYEKLKLLLPAYIDPQTKYRYYLPEQLTTLDIILLCIRLDIPLKTLNEYIDADGQLNIREILEYGKQTMQEKISEMQRGLEITQYNLDSIEQNRQYSSRHGIYTRKIEERYLYTAPFRGNQDDLLQKEKTAMELFQHAQVQNMAPVFPAGILIHCDREPYSFSFFVQVLRPAVPHPQIIHIPAAEFSCMQIELTFQTDLEQTLKANFSSAGETALIANMAMDQLHFSSRHSEIQVPVS